MIDVPADVAAAILDPHAVTRWTVHSLREGEETEELADVVPVSWSAIHESGMVGSGLEELRFIDPTGRIVPPRTRGPATPYGQQLRIYWHVRMADDRWYPLPIGTYAVDDFTSSNAPDGVDVIVKGIDRGQFAAERRAETPQQVLSGTPFDVAVEALLGGVMPWSRFHLPDVEHRTPGMIVDALDSRVAAAEDLATSVGVELYVDAMGDVRGYLADAVLDPAVTLITGPRDDPATQAVMLSDGRNLNPGDTYSAVLARGDSNAAAPVAVVVRDDNPTSPTYWRGDFGSKVFGYSSPLLNTRGKAVAAGRTVLSRKAGLAETVHALTLLDPRFRPGDAIRIRDPEQGIDGVHRIATIRLTSDVAEPAELDTRVRRVTELAEGA